MDDRTQRYFSVERLRRAMNIDDKELDEALNLLEYRVNVIGARQRDLKGRQVRYIRPGWLGNGFGSFGRQQLLAVLRPQPPKPHVPFGHARVLRTITIPCRRQLMTFQENEIVRDEGIISELLKCGAILAKLEDSNARMCGNKKCLHRFDLSESAPIDYPVLEAIRRDFITLPDSTSLTFKPGDIVTDRSLCLRLITTMPERIKHTLREAPPHDYMCCPKCKHVSRNNADLQLKKLA
jgi:hypothetical protein